METVILPGFSPKNKQWAEETQERLKSLGPVSIAYWDHWQTGSAEPDWIEKEAQKIIASLEGKTVNILSKSIGTAVAMEILRQMPQSINKVILCGIPITDFSEGFEKRYAPIKDFPKDKILCIQNSEDNHGGYAEAERLIHSISPDIQIISKLRSDHEYPYIEDFLKFFM